MKQYLFSTNDYYNEDNNYDEDSRFMDEDIILHNINKISNNCIMSGKVKRWDGIYEGLKYGKFIDLYNEILKDCDEYDIYVEDDILYIYGIHHDGYVKVSFYFINDKGQELYNQEVNNLNEYQLLYDILQHQYYIKFTDLYEKIIKA